MSFFEEFAKGFSGYTMSIIDWIICSLILLTFGIFLDFLIVRYLKWRKNEA
jgi:hypothetical protein